MKRVCVVYPRALVGDGGPTKAAWDWARALQAAGADVSVLAIDHNLRCPVYGGAKASMVTRLRRRGFVVRVAWFLARNRPDVIVLHSVFSPTNLFVAWVASRLGIPYVTTPHGGYHPRSLQRRSVRKRLAVRTAERRLLERAKFVHVYWPAEGEHVWEVAPRSRVLASPTGHEPASQQWSGHGATAPFLWFGRFDRTHKGLDLLFAGYALYESQGGRRPLHVYGRDHVDTSRGLTHLSQSMGCSNVHMRGELLPADRDETLSSCRALVAPSRWESHSLAVAEAIATGTPVVVTKATPIASEIASAGAALVIDGSPASIAEAMHSLDLTELCVSLSERSTSFLADRLSWQRSARLFLSGHIRDV
jgi:glycosyltransferase involved in cell wall biosynthesis